MRPGTLTAALELCGQGTVATFFGRLRPGVLVVDIDLDQSAQAVMAVVGWCAERGLWHLVRESGRSGHQHVFVVVGDRTDELERLAAELRGTLRVGRTAIDVRDTVRPLCAPHRSGIRPPMPKRMRSAARELAASLRNLGHSPAPVRPSDRRSAAAVVPTSGASRQLPSAWAAYLSEGRTPAQVRGWADRSRSAVESTATYQMVCAGWSHERAWRAVVTSHPAAMGKARAQGRSWWTKHVWNRAVGDHEKARSGRKSAGTVRGPDQELTAQVRQLQAAFLSVWTKYGRDRRHTLRFVLETLLERMVRTGSPIVPCPERDLVIDTGISSRQILRAALHQLHDDGWLVLRESFDANSTDPDSRSHQVGLPSRPPSAPPDSNGGDLALTYPPSSFTPLPLRPHLGPPLWHTLQALRSTPQPASAISKDPRAGAPTLRTVLNRLTSLAVLGLAQCDAQGNWKSVPATSELLRAAQLSGAARAQSVALERANYELVRSGRGRWEKQRREAIERGRAARYRGARAWWAALEADQRAVRSAEFGRRYAGLSLSEQVRLKDGLAQQRADAGVVSEEAVRQAWVDSMSDEQYTRRVMDRVVAFRATPPPLRAARAAAWEDHRRRWGTQRQSYPVGLLAGERLVDYQERVALGDALDRDPYWAKSGLVTSGAPPGVSEETA